MRRTLRNTFWLVLAILLLAASWAKAEPAQSFAEGKADNAELKYINDLPVLIVSGTPEEIGRQKAQLTGDVTKKLAEYPRLLLERSNHKDRLPQFLAMSRAVIAQLPPDYRSELLAFAELSGMDRDIGLLANTLADVYRGSFSCSSLIVEPERSATDGPLFGRNLDFYTLGLLDRYSLVTIHRPKGKHAFVSIGFPGLFGCLSGMNDAGLALAVHEVYLARDGAPLFNEKGVPYAFCFRQILEQCATVQEAEALLRATERTTILSLAVCDLNNGVVFELTPKTVAVRQSSDDICICTNHFRTDELAIWPSPRLCNRYPKLAQARKLECLDVADVARKMDEVNMGRLTVQTMIFEPAALKLHLAIGSCPSSSLPMKELDLKRLFESSP